MATYQKKLKRAKDGCYVRYIGKNASGQAEKFRLGFDLGEAEKREALILELWAHQERHTDPFLALGFHWTRDFLKAAKAIAKGKPPVLPPTYKSKTEPAKYVDALNEVGSEFSQSDPSLYDEGVEQISQAIGSRRQALGVDRTDPPNCWASDGPGRHDMELAEALSHDGEIAGRDPNAELRDDEARLNSLVIPDASEQLSELTACPSELASFINLTPNAEYGCYLPISWLIEFLQLEEGQTSRKEGLAWFYGPPHDQEECVYRASIEDGVLLVEVEVGPEVLTRRATFELFSVKEATSGDVMAAPRSPL